jgi:hypothetical protein
LEIPRERPRARAAAGDKSLLGGRHREPLAALGTAAAEDFTSTTGLLASAIAVRALTALVVRLVRTLGHGNSPPIEGLAGRGSILNHSAEVKVKPVDRCGRRPAFSVEVRSSLVGVLSLHTEIGI